MKNNLTTFAVFLEVLKDELLRLLLQCKEYLDHPKLKRVVTVKKLLLQAFHSKMIFFDAKILPEKYYYYYFNNLKNILCKDQYIKLHHLYH